jgi:hypothetical protein
MLQLRLRNLFALAALPSSILPIAPAAMHAQAPAAARQLGTVKAIDGNTVTLTTSGGTDVVVTVSPDTPVLQLAPGSTDLKSATPAKLEDVSVGDRILASGKAGEGAGTLTASRVVLMKSGDIAARNAQQQREWQRNGMGGLVRGFEGSTVTVVSGAKILKVETTPNTKFERYASDSVAFADVKAAPMSVIHTGDQLRARGKVADDRLSMIADEVVSGTFLNLSGTIASIDPNTQSLTVKDLATKRTYTVDIGQKSDLRTLPADRAAAFASRNSGGTGSGPASAPGAGGERPAGPGAPGGSGAGAGGAAAASRRAGFDLSQMLARLPTQTLADLKPGQAVMIVASSSGSGNPTAITMLSGVEQILSATPSGQQPLTLSPWNIGGAPEGGGEGGGGGSH